MPRLLSFSIIIRRSMSFSRIYSKFALKLIMLLLLIASAGIFFIARFVDQLYLQQPLILPQTPFYRQYHASGSDKSTQKERPVDEYEELGLKIAALIRTLADPEVDEALLNNHCEEENITSFTNEEIRFSLELDRLDCYGQILKDYKSEIITANFLALLPNERLVSTLKTIISYVEKNRAAVKSPTGKEKDRRLKRLNIHTLPPSTPQNSVPAWVTFQNRISKQALFLAEDQANIERLLHDLRTLPIDEIEEIPDLGTQIKLILVLADGSKALFKPKRVPRDLDETMDVYYMYEKERHTAEIASFHLNRILGFNTVPPVAGRFFNMTEELYPYVTEDVQEHFFRSPAGNICFFGQCDYFCDAANAVCGDGHVLEGSVAAFLPDKDLVNWRALPNPWKRSYSKYNKTEWETTKDPYGYCETVRETPPFNEDKALLSVIDSSIFDFLTGNKDRHHLYNFVKYGNNSYYILFDNGKGFGRAHDDIIDILAPLYQCCMIRFTTLRTLFQMHTSPDKRLSQLMKESLSSDVLPDILTSAHLRALDRRVRIILEQVLRCIKFRSKHQPIIIDDTYYFERG